MSDDEIMVCPECDDARIERRVGTDFAAVEAEAQWNCKNPACGAHFEEPATRSRNQPHRATSPATKALIDADPDDYPKGGSA